MRDYVNIGSGALAEEHLIPEGEEERHQPERECVCDPTVTDAGWVMHNPVPILDSGRGK